MKTRDKKSDERKKTNRDTQLQESLTPWHMSTFVIGIFRTRARGQEALTHRQLVNLELNGILRRSLREPDGCTVKYIHMHIL